MIGRIAEVKFVNTEDAFLPLHERCMLVLEYILPLVNRQVNPVTAVKESDSESDDDYWLTASNCLFLKLF